MSQTPKTPKKKNEVLGAISDFVILCLLLAGAGFGGYFYGTYQRLAPVQNVPPGTAGAVAQLPSLLPPSPGNQTPGTAQATPAQPTAPASTAPKKQKKFWVTSSGVEYMGYSITVKVNGETVDNFFGPGKTVDVTRFVKPGDNTVIFEAKALGEDYNKHPGDSNSNLTLTMVSGPFIREDYKKSDALLTYKRTAAETEDFNETMHFSGD